MTQYHQHFHYPLSSPQREIWFDMILHPDVARNNIGGYRQVEGAIDPEIFERAVNLLVKRHDALRTVLIPGPEEMPMQTFLEDLPVTVPFHDFFGENNPRQAALAWMQQQFIRPFDLYATPLFHFALLKVEENCFFYFEKYHHLIMDGWSISLIAQSLAEIYTQLIQDQIFEGVAPSYLVFVKNDRAYIESESYEAHRHHWMEKYKNLPEPLFPPHYSNRFVDRIPSAVRRVLPLSRHFYNRLIALAKSCKATIFHVILGACYVYLSRTSQSGELVMGLPALNRPNAVFKDTVGLFENVSVARFAFGTDLSFKTLLQSIGRELKQNYRHQRFPISELNREFRLHQVGRKQLFDISVSYEKHDYDASFDSYQTHTKTLMQGYEQTPLLIYLREFHADVDVEIEFVYNLAYFEAAEIDLIQSRFVLILEHVLNHVDEEIRCIPLLTKAEQQQLMAWNQTETDYPKDQTIVDLFEAQVEKTPENIAVVFEEHTLSYQELNAKANQLGLWLQGKGIKRGKYVPVLMTRGLEVLIAFLAIMKSGAAFVPIDIHWPETRIKKILTRLNSQVILVNRFFSFLSHLSVQNIKFINTSELKGLAANLDNSLTAKDPIYVMYTSGSTGEPKGAINQHCGIVNRFWYMNQTYGCYETDVILQTTYHHFDGTVWQLIWPLINGARTVIPSQIRGFNPKQMMELIAMHKVSIAGFVPSVLEIFLSELDNHSDNYKKIDSLRQLFVGGEAINPKTVSRIQSYAPNINITNAYGPTETSIGVVFYEIANSVPQFIPIGKPIANVKIWILDNDLNILPIGVPGELHISGVCVGLGYLNNEAQTKAHFISNPFTKDSGLLYKTGDLARYLPDGNIEYLGRIDNQVKIRGFRVELREIEVTLSRHEAIKEAVVVLHEREGNKALTAYVTMNNERCTMVNESDDSQNIEHCTLNIDLRGWLKEHLPDHMIPTSFIVLDKLPLTTNGKIDRKALPTPEFTGQAEQQAPRTQTERLLCNLWSQVLGIEVTSILSNFFEAGGDSLSATQLVSRIRGSFGVEMPLQVVFEQANVQEQAEWLDRQHHGVELPPIKPLPSDESLVLSFAQQRLWYLAQLEGQSATYNMPAALHLTGQLNETALQRAFKALIERHDSLRLCFPAVDGKATVQLIDVYNPLSITDLSELSETEQKRLVAEWTANHAQTPFDLSTGPLLSLRLLKLDKQKQILLFNMHHIISDGWSMDVLIREWRQLYNAYVQNQVPHLPKLPIQYTDYAAWQSNWLTGEILKRQLAYWIEKLSGAPDLLELPTDYPRPAVMKYQGNFLQSTLDQELARGIKQFSQQHGVTVFMTLLAAFEILLFRYSGQTDLVVGSGIANRTHHQTENLIGFFVNTVALRTQVKGEQTFLELLKKVRQTALEAYSHQDIPFEYLVEQLNPTRSPSYSPLIQVAFVLQNTPKEVLKLSGSKMSFLRAETLTAKFDLFLSVEEHGKVFVCDWEYNTNLFRSDTIFQMTEHFQVLLEGILNNSGQSLSKLPLLTEAEQQELMAWNQTETDYPKDQTIVDLFEAQVEKTPENIAIVFENQQLSYLELNQKANQLAHYLLNLKTNTDNCLVGICVERSLEMVIGLLGILKAGGAYVPLDPDYPLSRLQFMLEDSEVRLLLSQSHLLKRLPVSTTRVVCLDSEWEQIAAGSVDNPVRQSGPKNLAYVIYTSGSTGLPKGVMVEHIGLTNLIQVQIQAFDIMQGSRLLQFASLSFDASVSEIATTLTSGATLQLGPTNKFLPDEEFIKLINHQSITHVTLPPFFLAALRQEKLTGLETIVVAGEACSSELVEKWSSGRKFINAYGPTESTVCATLTECIADGNSPHIGKPIANTRIYIIDANHNPTPLGIPGELCIAGVGLARGYLNRPELTAEKFIEIELFGQHQRIYKTGDLARWLPDGNLEYLGRIDHQVKLRGFRIELGEIEACLAKHPKVQKVAVIVKESFNDKRLLAYFVPQSNNQSFKSSGIIDSESQVKQWQQIFDEICGQSISSEIDPKFNTIGWNSSYTGLPFSKAEMKEWLNGTVDQILSKSPNRILEIGCGTGMLLFQIAPYSDHYTGTDISSVALHYIEQQKKTWEFGSKVTLFQSAADNFEGIKPASYDAVILNSVVQYFPSIDYLITVLTGAIKVVAPGGFIFIADVRNLQLFEAFHASVQLYQAHDSLSLEELRQRVRKGMSNEKELLIDPDFFIALKYHFPQITRVQIQLKPGYARNEMSCFRYDVTLYIGGKSALKNQFQWLDLQNEYFTLAKVRQLLLEKQPELIGLKRIPNARILTEMKVVEQLVHPEGTVEDLRKYINQPNNGVEPEAFRALAHALSYTSYITYCDKYSYNVVFQHQDSHGTLPCIEEISYYSKRPWDTYANNPCQDNLAGQKIASQLRDFLKQTLPDYMIPSVFIPLESMPLTPTGKTNRRALAHLSVAMHQSKEDTLSPQTREEELLASIWEDVLGLERVGISDNFFEMGGDSILSIQIVARAYDAGLELTPRDILQHQTIAQLSRVVKPLSTLDIEQGPVTGEVPLTPIQHMFFARQTKKPWHFNQAVLLALPSDINETALQQALETILQHHDALRLRYNQVNGHWLGWHDVVSTRELPYHTEDLCHLAQELQAEAIRERANYWQASLNLESGPLVRLVLFHLGHESRLLWCIHHLVVDGVSWRILIEDLQNVYHQVCACQPVHLPAKTSSFKAWADHLFKWKNHESFAKQANYWYQLLKATPLPVDNPTARNHFADSQHYTIRFSADTTKRLLTEVPTAYRTQINDLLLTALMLTLHDWTAESGHLIDLESHGRSDLFEEIAISRTVGWFTALHTIYLELPDVDDLSDCLHSIHKQLLEIPHNGIGYGVLRYLKGEVLPQGQIVFNYLGQFDQSVLDSSFRFADESSGQSMSLEGERDHLIEINGETINKCLSFTWSYSCKQYHAKTVQQLADNYKQQLRRLIDLCGDESAKLLNTNKQYVPHEELLGHYVVHIHPKGKNYPFFCLPGMWGDVNYLYALSVRLGSEQPFYGLQTPGLDGKIPLPNSIEEQASYHLRDMRHIQPHGPYFIGGHSFGGAVAFEIVRQLEQQGEMVELLVLFDLNTSHINEKLNLIHFSEIDWILFGIQRLEATKGTTFGITREMLETNKDDESRSNFIAQHLKAYDVIPGEATPKKFQTMLQAFKSNCLNFERYIPNGIIAASTLLFRAEHSLESTTNDNNKEQHWGWDKYTNKQVEVIWISGNHFTMLNEPNVKQLAAQLHHYFHSSMNTE